jgi:soluble lytic murein transglycosylase-like protein
MTPSAVTELMGRIATLRQPPAAAGRFAGALATRAATGAATTAAAVTTEATASVASPSGGATASTAAVAARRAVTAAVTTALPTKRSPLPAAAAPYADMIRKTATKQGVDPDLLNALVWVESSFQPDAVSPAGAIGLAQLMPGTARSLRVDPRDPAQNVDGSARMLAGLIEEFGRVDHALAAYNVGPNGLKQGLAEGRTPGAGYAKAVADKYRIITGRELF